MKKYIIIIILIWTSWVHAQTSSDSVYVRPEPLLKTTPEYPEAMRKTNIEGTVILSVKIKSDSTLASTLIIQSIPAFDSLAMQEVKKWTWKPATLNGTPVDGYTEVGVDFFQKKDTLSTEKNKINSVLIRQQILEYIRNNISRRKDIANKSYYYANYHISGLPESSKLIQRNGFILANPVIFDYANYHNYYQFHTMENKVMYEIQDSIYNIPASITHSEFGNGPDDLNYAMISFLKGDGLGIKNLSLKLDFLALAGYWHTTNEKASDFNWDLNYKYEDFSVKYSGTNLNRNIPTTKINSLIPFTQDFWAVEKSQQNQILASYKIFGAGYSNSEYNLKLQPALYDLKSRQKDIQFYIAPEYGILKSKISYQFTKFELVKDTLNSENDFHNLTLESNIKYHTYSSNIKYSSQMEETLFEGTLNKTLSESFNLGIQIQSAENNNRFFQPKVLNKKEISSKFRIGFTGWGLENQFSIGTYKLNQVSYLRPTYFELEDDMLRVENDFSYNFTIDRFQFKTKDYTCYKSNTEGFLYQPEMVNNLQFGINYSLLHDNSLELGCNALNLYNYTDYIATDNSSDNVSEFNLDLYLSLFITKQFEGKVVYRNLTSQGSFYSQYLEPGAIYLNLRWNFIN